MLLVRSGLITVTAHKLDYDLYIGQYKPNRRDDLRVKDYKGCQRAAVVQKNVFLAVVDDGLDQKGKRNDAYLGYLVFIALHK